MESRVPAWVRKIYKSRKTRIFVKPMGMKTPRKSLIDIQNKKLNLSQKHITAVYLIACTNIVIAKYM